MSEYTARLKKMKDKWSEAKDSPNPFDINIVTSKYRVQVQSLEITESNGGLMMIKREHLILAGEYENETVTDFMMIESADETKNPFKFIQIWIDKLGYAIPDDPSELEAVLDQIVQDAPICSVKVKVKDGFANINLLEVESSGADAAPAEEVAEETPAEEAPAEEAPTEEIDDASKAGLLALCQQFGIGVVDETTPVDELKEVIKTCEFEASDLMPEELELLEANGLGGQVKKAAPVRKAAPAPVKKPAQALAKKPVTAPVKKPIARKR